jgi:hypothetical protein
MVYIIASPLVEGDLGSGLHVRGILVEGAVRLVALLLNGGAVLHQLLGHGLAGGLEDVDQSAGEVLLGLAEEGDGAAVLTCAAGTVKEDKLVSGYRLSGS